MPRLLFLKMMRELLRSLKGIAPGRLKSKLQQGVLYYEHRLQRLAARGTAEVDVGGLWGSKPPKHSPAPRAVDILIPVYNGYDFLVPCLESVLRNTDLPFHIYLGHDHSTDERVGLLLQSYQARYPQLITLFQHEQNKGFVKNCNYLIEASQNDFVLLNTDTEVPPGWASRLFYPIFSDPRVAIAGPWTNSGSQQAFFFGHKAHALDIPYLELDEFVRHFSPDVEVYFPHLTGFCLAVSRQAQQQIGLLDEVFGRGYFEETDFCLRAHKLGFLQRLSVNLFVYHKGGCSFQAKESTDWMHRNQRIFNKRHPQARRLMRQAIEQPVFEVLHFLLLLEYARAKNPGLLEGRALKEVQLKCKPFAPPVYEYELVWGTDKQTAFLRLDQEAFKRLY